VAPQAGAGGEADDVVMGDYASVAVKGLPGGEAHQEALLVRGQEEDGVAGL